MRPAFMLNAELRPQSVLIPKERDGALSVGISVLLDKDYTTEYGVIPAGTKGFVEHVDQDSGSVEILMEGLVPALLHWGNKAILVPFDTDDLADCLVCALRQIKPLLESSTLISDNVTQLRIG